MGLGTGGSPRLKRFRHGLRSVGKSGQDESAVMSRREACFSQSLMDALNGRAKLGKRLRGMSMVQGIKQTHSKRYRILSGTPECSVKGKEKEKKKKMW